MITKDLLIIGGYNKIYIINVNQYTLIREIEIPNSSYINRFCKLNENMFLTGRNGIIIQWKIDGDNIILISKEENVHDSYIYALLNIGDGLIASCSGDNLIKIWKYN